jgi:ABC-type glycerol-3-phosphate transport system substrate-binding protein
MEEDPRLRSRLPRSRRWILRTALGTTAVALLQACGATTPAATTVATAPLSASVSTSGTAATPPSVSAAASTLTAATVSASPATVSASTSTVPKAAASTPAAGVHAVVFSSWATSGVDLQRTQAQVDAYTKAFPGRPITLDNLDNYLQTLTTRLASGTGPDVFRLHWPDLVPFQANLALMDVLLAKHKVDWWEGSDLKPAYKRIAPIGGHILGLPEGVDVNNVFYNASMFTDAGLTAPPLDYGSADWTIEHILDDAKRITKRATDGTTIQYGSDVPEGWQTLPAYVAAFGGNMFDDQGLHFLWTEPNGYEPLQQLADFIVVHKVAPPDDKKNNFKFEKSQLGMHFGQVSQAKSYLTSVSPGMQWNSAPAPGWGGKPATTIVEPTAWSLNRDSKAPDDAWDFYVFVNGPQGSLPEVDTAFGIPTFQSLDKDYATNLVAAGINVKPGLGGWDHVLQSFPIGVPGFSSAWTLIDKALADVRAGKSTAKTAMESIKTPVETALAKGHATLDAIAARTS